MRSKRLFSVVLLLALVVLGGRLQGAIWVIKQGGGGDFATVMAAIAGSANTDTLQFGDAGIYNEVTNAGSSFDFGGRQVYGMGFLPTLTGTDTGWGGNEEIVTLGQNGRLEGVKVVTGSLTKDVILTDSRGSVVKGNVIVMDGMTGPQAEGIRVMATSGNTAVIEGNKITLTGAATAATAALMSSQSPGSIIYRNNIVDFLNATSGTMAGYSTDNRSAAYLINNTILFGAAGTSTGFDMTNVNNDHNDFLQNNILVGADTGITARDTAEAGTTTITDQNNLFYNVTTRWSPLNGAILNTSNAINGLDPLLNALYVPGAGSPAINAGLVGANYGASDYYGNLRVAQGVVDIGAVEVIPEPATLSLLALAGLLAFRRRR
jgi:hypothetical protein